MKSILADSVFSKTIELFVHFLERIVLFNAEYDDGIAAILAVAVSYTHLAMTPSAKGHGRFFVICQKK